MWTWTLNPCVSRFSQHFLSLSSSAPSSLYSCMSQLICSCVFKPVFFLTFCGSWYNNQPKKKKKRNINKNTLSWFDCVSWVFCACSPVLSVLLPVFSVLQWFSTQFDFYSSLVLIFATASFFCFCCLPVLFFGLQFTLLKLSLCFSTCLTWYFVFMCFF